MDSSDGIPLEDEKNLTTEKVNGEGLNFDSSEPLSGGNEACKDLIKDEEGADSSGSKVISRPSIQGKEDSKPNGVKNSKSTKNLKKSVVSGQSTKPNLSQSLSFPAKGRHSDVMKRSIDVYPMKPAVAKPQKNGAKAEHFKGGTGAVKASVIRRSLPAKLTTNGIETNPSSDGVVQETCEEVNNDLPVKEEEDADVITSSNATPEAQQKINASAFPFRLEERAAKRKEFFSKIEKKIHAKEEEVNNLEAKSKENQEAEIKQLRKSLTFKATPMPSFYKDPPPAAELKKIPTTRPVSPKLGRRKSTVSTTGNSLENGGPTISPGVTSKASETNGDRGNTTSKKFIRSVSKPGTRRSLPERKVKHPEIDGQVDQVSAGDFQEPEDHVKDCSVNDPCDKVEAFLDPCDKVEAFLVATQKSEATHVEGNIEG